MQSSIVHYQYALAYDHPQPLPPKEVLIEVEYNWDRERIRQEVEKWADVYHVNPDEMWNVIKCENPILDPKLQSLVVKNGIRENSWGLAQIHLDAHTSITKKQAQNPIFAIEFMAKNFSQGVKGKRMWTCWRNIYGV